VWRLLTCINYLPSVFNLLPGGLFLESELPLPLPFAAE
jgi:hypothetical protein